MHSEELDNLTPEKLNPIVKEIVESIIPKEEIKIMEDQMKSF